MQHVVADPKREQRQLLMRRLSAIRTGNSRLTALLNKQLAELSCIGVHPEVEGSMIGHCGRWHKVPSTLPMVTECCGRVLLAKD